MRIGQLSDCFLPIVDGVGRVVYSYAEGLGNLGQECYVIAPMNDSGFRGKFSFELVDYKSFSLPAIRQYRSGLPLLDSRYRKRVNQIPFDILHAHSPFIAGNEAIRLKKKLGVPLVGSFHSKYYDDFYKIFKNKSVAGFGARRVADFYRACDLVFAVSHDSARELASYGYTGDIRVMPNGTDLRPVDEAKADAVRARYPEKKLLLFVGQLDWKKNILRSLEVVAALKQAGQPVQLILAGQGPDKAAIAHKISQLGLNDRVSFVGHIADRSLLDAYYHAADLFLFPSIYDNAPMVVREAAAMETPALLISGSSAAEVVTDGVNGFLCPDNTAAIAARITALLANPAQLQAAGKEARKTIPVPWQSILTDVLAEYEALLRRQNR